MEQKCIFILYCDVDSPPPTSSHKVFLNLFDLISFKLDPSGNPSREKAGQLKELWDVSQRGE